MFPAPHEPVLLQSVTSHFEGRNLGVFVDGTVGAGGHAAAILESCSVGRYIGLDKDATALELARKRLSSHRSVELCLGDFRNLNTVLRGLGVESGQVDGILLDVGVSSMQLDTPDRGFSFMRDGPLDMRMATGSDAVGPSAEDLVNDLQASDLERIFRTYGEEPRARMMANRIVRARTEGGRITRTVQLADILSGGIRKTARGVHPATLCFQALRIAVNGELEALEDVIPAGISMLRPGSGRLAVISFHSLEDRIVKHSFLDLAKQQGGISVLTKRPIVATEAEAEANVRSRSAKLRVAQRLAEGEMPRIGKVNKYRPGG